MAITYVRESKLQDSDAIARLLFKGNIYAKGSIRTIRFKTSLLLPGLWAKIKV